MAKSELSLLRWPPHHYEAAAILKYKHREYGTKIHTNGTEMITILYRDTHTDTTTWVCVIYMSVCLCVCVCTLHISWAAKYFSWLRQLLLTQFCIVISLWFLLLHFIYALAIYRCCLPFGAGLFFYVASCLHMANVTIAIAAASTASYELHCCIVKSWNKQPISESTFRERERERDTTLSNGTLFAVGLIESASCLLADSKICDSQMLRSALAGTYSVCVACIVCNNTSQLSSCCAPN